MSRELEIYIVMATFMWALIHMISFIALVIYREEIGMCCGWEIKSPLHNLITKMQNKDRELAHVIAYILAWLIIPLNVVIVYIFYDKIGTMIGAIKYTRFSMMNPNLNIIAFKTFRVTEVAGELDSVELSKTSHFGDITMEAVDSLEILAREQNRLNKLDCLVPIIKSRWLEGNTTECTKNIQNALVNPSVLLSITKGLKINTSIEKLTLKRLREKWRKGYHVIRGEEQSSKLTY